MIDFLLNGERVQTQEPQGLLLLDFLRLRRRLTGTKEGCKEGDCGACTVLLGQLQDGHVRYRSVTSCLVPLGEAHGKHVVTVEGVNVKGLNPVQAAMVDHGGSQCGFCTPGFIVSMCGHVLGCPKEDLSVDGFKHAVGGNLCRCTGYGSIVRASTQLVEQFGPGGQWEGVWMSPDRVSALVDEGLFPSHFAKAASVLAEIEPYQTPARNGHAPVFIAGGTDLYVQRGEELPGSSVRVLNHETGMSYVRQDGDTVHVGGLTTFEEFAEAIEGMLPEIRQAMFIIASLQIRNRASLSGNIINASPIGDMTNYMLALGGELTLEDPQGARRTVPMKRFFLGYKKLDKAPEELLVEITFPAVVDGEHVSFEKVSKRVCLDIATVNSAARLRVNPESGVVERAWISVGGVAATPLLLERTGALLEGRVLTSALVSDALNMVQEEISPISDVRGSAQYKRLLARQLVLGHFLKLYPQRVQVDQLITPQNRGANA